MTDKLDLQRGIRIILKTAEIIPNAPGIYKMLGDKQEVLYIGKAKDLKKRIKQYANIINMPNRLKLMISSILEIEFLITQSEIEALLLEANLIHAKKPKFNIALKDDKSFPYIALSNNHAFPQIFKYRGKRQLNALYFGPFAAIQQLEQMIIQLEKIFKLRSCTDSVFANRTRPCLLYQVARCSAPCVGKISQDEYKRSIEQAKLFLSGKTKIIQKQLLHDMEEASNSLEFERAAKIRDTISLLNKNTKTIFFETSASNTDILTYAVKGEICCIQIIIMRHNQNYGHTLFYIKIIDLDDLESQLMLFCLNFYRKNLIPENIWINLKKHNMMILQNALKQMLNKEINISYPEKDPLIEFAMQNVEIALNNRIQKISQNDSVLEKLAEVFQLKSIPSRIEIYDNSHIQGQYAVGGMVVANQEGFLKDQYRKFIIRDHTIKLQGGDDYAMMREVINRRMDKLTQHNKPDLIIIDGGKGHLSSILEVLKKKNIDDIKVISIAKGEDRNSGKEVFFGHDKKPVNIDHNDPLRYYLQNLRDEAHRFAITTYRKLHRKKMMESEILAIPGVGKKRWQHLLTIFGSKQGVFDASCEELQQVKDIGKNMAARIYNYLHGKKHI